MANPAVFLIFHTAARRAFSPAKLPLV